MSIITSLLSIKHFMMEHNLLKDTRQPLVKVERFYFALDCTTAVPIFGSTQTVSFNSVSNLKLDKLTVKCNVFKLGQFIIQGFFINQIPIYFRFPIDAFHLGMYSLNRIVINPYDRVRVFGKWTSQIPEGYKAGQEYPLCIAIIGSTEIPATA